MKAEIFEDAGWQMSLGERAAVEGLLAQLEPALAIAVGVDDACLGRIAAHCGEVHAFGHQPQDPSAPDTVAVHAGEPREELSAFLGAAADGNRTVDFALIDGGRDPAGLRRIIEALLDSPAVADAVILVHDTADERVRGGFDAVPFRAWPKVAYVDPDWVPGELFVSPERRNEPSYGLALVHVDVSRPAYLNGEVFEQRYYPAGHLLAEMRQLVIAREGGAGADRGSPEVEALHDRIAALERELASASVRAARTGELAHELDIARQIIDDLKGSVSWRITEPLRAAKRYRGQLRENSKP